jgi:DNA primase
MSFYKYDIPYKETASGELRFCCPKCVDSDYHLYYSPSRRLYHCFKCGYKGRGFPRSLPLSQPLLSSRLPPKESTVEEDIRELSWQELTFPPSSTLELVVWDYLQSRGVTEEQVKKFKLGWSPEKPFVVVFPIIMHDTVKALQIRHLTKLGPKYVFYDVGKRKTQKSALLYNYDNCIRGVTTLYIVEGVLDVILAAPRCSLCTFGKSLSIIQSDLIRGIPKQKLVLAFDSDVKPRELIQTIERLEVYEPVYIKQLPKGKDPADLGEEFLGLPEIPSFEWLTQF